MATSTAKRYRGEEHFIDGYVPQSMNAEYSSLHRSITWIGMGCLLASLAPWGIFVFGLSTMFQDNNTAHEFGHVPLGESELVASEAGSFDPSLFLWGGLGFALLLTLGGLALISLGRREYKKYRREFGAHH